MAGGSNGTQSGNLRRVKCYAQAEGNLKFRDPGIFLAFALAAFAQPPTKFVTLDIVATGPRGQPVSDLRADEIRLFDESKPQSIAYWHFNRRPPETAGVTVVVFNLQSAWIKGVEWNDAVRAMRRFESSDYLYFYALTVAHALLPIHALPKPDSDVPPANPPWMAGSLPPFEAMWNIDRPGRARPNPGPCWVGDPATGNPRPMVPWTCEENFSLYLDLATRLAAFPGRKSLVCINCLFAQPGYFNKSTDPAWNARSTDLRQLAEAFRQARVTVYPIGGKAATGAGGNSDTGNGGGSPSGPLAPDQFGAFADFTGGRAYSAGEVGQAITEAVADGHSSYRIAYLPGSENWDGKRHKIRLVCTRKGVRVLALKWYDTDLPEDIAREWNPAIPDPVITSPFDWTDIAVSVSPPEKLASALRFQVHVDAAGVLLLPREGRYSGSLTLQAFCYRPEGRRLACTEPMRVKLDLSSQEHETALRVGVRIPVEVPSRDLSSRIRIVVHDESSQASGSSTFRVSEAR